jgi:hypothetical protein
VRVPEEAGQGKARIILSFPDWKGSRVVAATLDVPVVDRGAAPAKPK